jgi:hypothetical protein
MSKKYTVLLISILVLMVLIYSQLTFFVVAPIGAVPEGRTVVMLRLNKTQFIDSADGICDRVQGGVSLMCRMFTMGAVLEKATIIARLPYSETLYSISTGGKKYDR